MARAKYYWPTMRLDIEEHIEQCLSFAETKGTTTAPILEYPFPAGPFDVVGIDLLQLPRSTQCSVYVFVCVDHLSRFTVLAPLPNKFAATVAHAIVSHLVYPYIILLVFSSVTIGQNLRTRSFGKSALNYTFNKHLLHRITLLLTAPLNVPIGKSLIFCATLQDVYRKLGRIGFLT